MNNDLIQAKLLKLTWDLRPTSSETHPIEYFCSIKSMSKIYLLIVFDGAKHKKVPRIMIKGQKEVLRQYVDIFDRAKSNELRMTGGLIDVSNAPRLREERIFFAIYEIENSATDLPLEAFEVEEIGRREIGKIKNEKPKNLIIITGAPKTGTTRAFSFLGHLSSSISVNEPFELTAGVDWSKLQKVVQEYKTIATEFDCENIIIKLPVTSTARFKLITLLRCKGKKLGLDSIMLIESTRDTEAVYESYYAHLKLLKSKERKLYITEVLLWKIMETSYLAKKIKISILKLFYIPSAKLSGKMGIEIEYADAETKLFNLLFTIEKSETKRQILEEFRFETSFESLTGRIRGSNTAETFLRKG